VLMVDVRILRGARPVSLCLSSQALRAAPDTDNPLRAHKVAFPLLGSRVAPKTTNDAALATQPYMSRVGAC